MWVLVELLEAAATSLECISAGVSAGDIAEAVTDALSQAAFQLGEHMMLRDGNGRAKIAVAGER